MFWSFNLIENHFKKYAVGKADEIKLMGFVGWKTLDPQNRENMENNPGKKCSYFQGEKSHQYNRLDTRHSYQVFVDHGDEGELWFISVRISDFINQLFKSNSSCHNSGKAKLEKSYLIEPLLKTFSEIILPKMQIFLTILIIRSLQYALLFRADGHRSKKLTSQ